MKQKKEMEDILSRSSLKENPFGVPAGYFTSVQDEVMQKISAMPVAQPYSEEAEEAAPATFMTYFKPAFALVAVFAMVFGIGWSTMKLTGTYTSGSQENATILSETLQDEISEDDIISILDITVEDLYADGDSDVQPQTETTELDMETIEQYLIDTRLPSTAIALLE